MNRDRDNAGYPEDFKIEAVRLMRDSGKTVRELASDLELRLNT